ncbi:MAG: protein kinase [Planctomycetaceae bacterium]
MNSAVNGYVTVNAEELDRAMLRANIDQEALLDAGLAPATIRRCYSGEQIQQKSLKKILRVLRLPTDPRTVSRYVRTADEAGSGTGGDDVEVHCVGPWSSEQRPSPWINTSNGLQYRIFRMRHVCLPATFGRGKCYDLAQFNGEIRESMAEALIRHPFVCRQLESCAAFPRNEHTGPAGRDFFWVIDREEPGVTLTDHMLNVRQTAGTGLSPFELHSLMTQLAAALVQLHSHQIVRRELLPDNVILRSDGTILLTDLELARLLSHRPSVRRGHLPRSPYLAPEIEAPEAGPAVDVYSWGKLFLYAANGRPPEEVIVKADLSAACATKEIRDLVGNAVSPTLSFRPTADQLLAAMKKWKVSP